MTYRAVIALSALLLAACGGGEGAQIETNPDEMTPEEAAACLQDEECLERVSEGALEDVTETVPEETEPASNELLNEAEAAMESLEYAAGGAGAEPGDDLFEWLSEDMISAYETLDFAMGDGEVSEDEASDVLSAVSAITAAVADGTATRERGGGSASLGDAITLHGFEDDLAIRVKVVRVIDPARAEEFFGPSSGKRFVAVELRMTNTGSAVYNDSPGNGAALIDNRDRQYTETLAESPSCPYIGPSVRIRPGDARAGCLLFEMPKRNKARAFQMTLESGFADETGEWSLR